MIDAWWIGLKAREIVTPGVKTFAHPLNQLAIYQNGTAELTVYQRTTLALSSLAFTIKRYFETR